MKQTLCSVLPASPTIGDVTFRDDGTFYCCYADGVWTLVGGAAPNPYSLSEVQTSGVWINGDPIYRKVVDVSPLPPQPGKSVAHGIVGLRLITNMWGIATDTGPGPYFVLHFGHAHAAPNEVIRLTLDQTNINIEVGTDQIAFNSAYVMLEYTRNP